jgi:putative membrane protein
MGLANLVPGISGGTMLLAAGVYPLFITAIAEVTSFRFEKKSFMVLGAVGLSAAMSILIFAGLFKSLVLEHRWIMYSLFIGLTLGGVPILKKLLGSIEKKDVWALLSGFLIMVVVGLSQTMGWGTGGDESQGWFLLFIAGTAGASAMILPGVSGGYLLLVLGCYIPILSGIDAFKTAIKVRDQELIIEAINTVILPVGLGVVFGIVVVSHLLKICLERFERHTYGVLLGLLLGAVIGLYPFQQSVPLESIETVKAQSVVVIDGALQYLESGKLVSAKDIPTEFVLPDLLQVFGSLLFMVTGLAITLAVSWYGSRKDKIEA